MGFSTITFAIISLIITKIIYNSIDENEGENNKDYTYDQLKFRYKRIRNNYISLLKDINLSNSDVKDIVNSIYDIDIIIDNTYEVKNVYNALANLIYSKARLAKNSIREQQLLEEMVSNDLYLLSADIKTLNQDT